MEFMYNKNYKLPPYTTSFGDKTFINSNNVRETFEQQQKKNTFAAPNSKFCSVRTVWENVYFVYMVY